MDLVRAFGYWAAANSCDSQLVNVNVGVGVEGFGAGGLHRRDRAVQSKDARQCFYNGLCQQHRVVSEVSVV